MAWEPLIQLPGSVIERVAHVKFAPVADTPASDIPAADMPSEGTLTEAQAAEERSSAQERPSIQEISPAQEESPGDTPAPTETETEAVEEQHVQESLAKEKLEEKLEEQQNRIKKWKATLRLIAREKAELEDLEGRNTFLRRQLRKIEMDVEAAQDKWEEIKVADQTRKGKRTYDLR